MSVKLRFGSNGERRVMNDENLFIVWVLSLLFYLVNLIII